MKTILHLDSNDCAKGFMLECDVIEGLIINKALRVLYEDPDTADSDRLIARRMHDEMVNAKEVEQTDIPTMYYPQVDGITPSVIVLKDEQKEGGE